MSKLASLIARKADKITDKISDSLNLRNLSSSSSKLNSSSRSRQPSFDGGAGEYSGGRTSFDYSQSVAPQAAPSMDRMAAAAVAAAAAAKAAALTLQTSAVAPAAPDTASPLPPVGISVRSSSPSRGGAPRMSSSGIAGGDSSTSAPPPLDPPSTEASSPSWGAGESLGMHAFEVRPSRKGIYLQLLGEQVEVLAEKGTKVSPSFIVVLPYCTLWGSINT